MPNKITKIILWSAAAGLLLFGLYRVYLSRATGEREALPTHNYFADSGDEGEYGWSGLGIGWRYRDIDDGGLVRWITGFNFDGKSVYGKTPLKWFVITSSGGWLDKLLWFDKETEFNEYVAGNKVALKKLIEVPIIKLPVLPKGYYLSADLGLFGRNSYADNVTIIGVFKDYIVGKGRPYGEPDSEARWFAVNMDKGEVVFKDSLAEVAAVFGADTEGVKARLTTIPDLHSYVVKYKLPFENANMGGGIGEVALRGYLGTSVSEVGGDGEGIKFLVYFKFGREYAFGKTWHEYFIYNDNPKQLLYFDKKDDWLVKLRELGETPDNFVPVYPESYYEQPPWLKPKIEAAKINL